MLRNVLCLLGAMWCSVGFSTHFIDSVDWRVAIERETDCRLCGGVDSEGVYIAGSLWERKDEWRSFLLYRPVDLAGKASAEAIELYRADLFDILRGFPEDFACVLKSMCDFRKRGCCVKMEKNQFPCVPENDLICTVVSAVMAALIENIGGWDGELHPRFESWARYDNSCRVHTRDKEIFCTKTKDGLQYLPGSIWVNCANFMLCWKPEGGPPWLCYRHSLESVSALCDWPYYMRGARDALATFACDKSDVSFQVFAGANAEKICAIVRAVLARNRSCAESLHFFDWNAR